MKTEHVLLHANGWVPNNPRLPVLIYRSAVASEGDEAAEAFERLFAEHGWPPQWRDGVFDYYHYHSTAHEALGVAAGRATLMLGGPDGRAVEIEAGDAIVLPAGTGHCQVKASADFLVVGAYPKGQDWDICRDAPSEEMRARIATLPVPKQDPIAGSNGALRHMWDA
jgi:uncharacterized protein YjlB